MFSSSWTLLWWVWLASNAAYNGFARSVVSY